MVLAVLYIWNASANLLGLRDLRYQNCLPSCRITDHPEYKFWRQKVFYLVYLGTGSHGEIGSPGEAWQSSTETKVTGNNRAERGHGSGGCRVKQQRKDGLQEPETLQQPLREGDSSAQWLDNNEETQTYWEPISHFVS